MPALSQRLSSNARLAPLDFSACWAPVWSDCMSTAVARRMSSASSRTSAGSAVAPGPDAARKRLPLHENGFHIRQNEIRQPHRDDYNGISLPRWGRIELASEAIPGTSQSGDLPRRSQAQREKAAGDLYE